MNFHVVFKHDGGLQHSTPQVAKETVAIGLYKELRQDLWHGVKNETIKTGYIRLYCGSKLMREFSITEDIIMQAPAERTSSANQEGKELGSMGAFVS